MKYQLAENMAEDRKTLDDNDNSWLCKRRRLTNVRNEDEKNVHIHMYVCVYIHILQLVDVFTWSIWSNC